MGKSRESRRDCLISLLKPSPKTEQKCGECCLRWGSPVVQVICAGITPGHLVPSDGYTSFCLVSPRTPPALACPHLTTETPFGCLRGCLCRLHFLPQIFHQYTLHKRFSPSAHCPGLQFLRSAWSLWILADGLLSSN